MEFFLCPSCIMYIPMITAYINLMIPTPYKNIKSKDLRTQHNRTTEFDILQNKSEWHTRHFLPASAIVVLVLQCSIHCGMCFRAISSRPS